MRVPMFQGKATGCFVSEGNTFTTNLTYDAPCFILAFRHCGRAFGGLGVTLGRVISCRGRLALARISKYAGECAWRRIKGSYARGGRQRLRCQRRGNTTSHVTHQISGYGKESTHGWVSASISTDMAATGSSGTGRKRRGKSDRWCKREREGVNMRAR
jgi:hypothetical protein